MNNSRSSSKATAEDNRQTLSGWMEANREDARQQGKAIKHVQRWLMQEGLAKSVDVKALTPRQRRIIALIFTEGRKQLRYKSLGRNTSLIAWIAQRTNIHRNHVGKAIRELEGLEYVTRSTENGEESIWITGGLFDASLTVQERWQLRQGVGAAWAEVVTFGIDKAVERVDELAAAYPRAWSDKARREVYNVVLAEVLEANHPKDVVIGNVRELWRYQARRTG